MSEHTFETEEMHGSRSLDPVTLQVIGGELDTIVEEMGYKLIRSAYSAIIRENEDMGCGIFTRDFREVAESDFTPMHVGSLPGYLRGMARAIEERGQTIDDIVNPGDVFLHNHSHYGASHASDIAAIIPIFHNNTLIGWSANTAHILDIGSAKPGASMSTHDMYAEGELMKARKVISEGERIEPIWNHLQDNMRTWRLNEGDLEAMISSVEIGRDRYLELIDEWGYETIQEAGKDLIDYAATLLRSRVADLPDGEWHETGFIDGGEILERDKLKIDVKVRIDGDDLIIDLTDSCEQTQLAINSPLDGSTKVCAYFTLRSILLDPETYDEYIPMNSGTFEPVTIETEKGTIVDPSEPRSSYSRIEIVSMMADLIVKAMCDIAPGDAMAGHGAQEQSTIYTGKDEDSEEYWVHLELNKTAYGGRPDDDGIDAISGLATNIRNTPIEDIELTRPLRVDRYSLREHGTGAGRTRGGRGSIREVTMLDDAQIMLTSTNEHVPWGAFGGEDGESGSFWHLSPGQVDEKIYSDPASLPGDADAIENNESVTELPSLVPTRPINAGDRIISHGPVCGGYGEPHERPRKKVLADYLDDLITESQARDLYGVAIEEDEINHEKTDQLRE